MGPPGGIIVMIIITIVMMIAVTDTGTTKEPELAVNTTTKEPELAVTTTTMGPIPLEVEPLEQAGAGQEDDNFCFQQGSSDR